MFTCGHVHITGERLHVQRLRVFPVDPVAGAAQPREISQTLRLHARTPLPAPQQRLPTLAVMHGGTPRQSHLTPSRHDAAGPPGAGSLAA